jgi:hypothetical protein
MSSDTAHNDIYILDILKLFSVIIMVTHVNAVVGDKSGEDEELVYAGEYLDITRTPKSDYTKNLRVRRLICRVCNFKFKRGKKLKTISDVSTEDDKLKVIENKYSGVIRSFISIILRTGTGP